MVIAQSLAIPPKTVEGKAVAVETFSTLPYLAQVEILFPQGCAGLVKARVKDRGAQVAPLNCDKYLEGSPYLLVFEGYNEDDLYQHTVTVRYTLK